MKYKTQIILIIAIFLTAASAVRAQMTTWDFNGVVTFCDDFACGLGDVALGDSFRGYITANTAPNSTVDPGDITGFLLLLGDLSADSQDGSVISSTVQTDANGEFESGLLVLGGTIDGVIDLELTFDIDGDIGSDIGTWRIETDFLGIGLITSGTGDWGIELDDDGIGAIEDNCTEVANADQRDTDADGFGNACDPDFDQSCTVNFADVLTVRQNFLLSGDLDTDLNGDNLTNFADLFIMEPMMFGNPGPSGIPNICGQ